MSRKFKTVTVLAAIVGLMLAAWTPVHAAAPLPSESSGRVEPGPIVWSDWRSANGEARIGWCTGSTFPPELEVVRNANGNPKFRRVIGHAVQNCGSDRPYAQQLCIKLQVDANHGPGAPLWLDFFAGGYDSYCNTNTGPNISANFSLLCSQLGEGTYRTAARGRVYPAGSGMLTRYGYSASRHYCA